MRRYLPIFKNLKTHSGRNSKYRNLPPTDGRSQGLHNFHSNPKSSTDANETDAETNGNEADYRVNCRVCGFPCVTHRDVRQKEGTWAGTGVSLGEQKTASSSPLSDGRSIAAGTQTQNADKYYDRTIIGGCPCCGTYDYDR